MRKKSDVERSPRKMSDSKGSERARLQLTPYHFTHPPSPEIYLMLTQPGMKEPPRAEIRWKGVERHTKDIEIQKSLLTAI